MMLERPWTEEGKWTASGGGSSGYPKGETKRARVWQKEREGKGGHSARFTNLRVELWQRILGPCGDAFEETGTRMKAELAQCVDGVRQVLWKQGEEGGGKEEEGEGGGRRERHLGHSAACYTCHEDTPRARQTIDLLAVLLSPSHSPSLPYLRAQLLHHTQLLLAKELQKSTSRVVACAGREGGREGGTGR
jgi:hypothetical protein